MALWEGAGGREAGRVGQNVPGGWLTSSHRGDCRKKTWSVLFIHWYGWKKSVCFCSSVFLLLLLLSLDVLTFIKMCYFDFWYLLSTIGTLVEWGDGRWIDKNWSIILYSFETRNILKRRWLWPIRPSKGKGFCGLCFNVK